MVKKTLSQSKLILSQSRITRSQSQIINNFDEISRLSEKKIASQIYLEDNQESVSYAPSELCFDNFDETSLQASNGADTDRDDDLFSDNESTASFRYNYKSITKSQKAIKYAKNGKQRSSRLIRTANSFCDEEDKSPKMSAYDYSMMRFQNMKKKKTFRIYCFNENDLNIPEKFQENIVQNESDDDKESDTEQIDNAVNHVHQSLLEAVEEEKAN